VRVKADSQREVTDAEKAAAFRLFEALAPDEQRALMKRARWRRVAAGQEALDVESAARGVSFVARGRVRVMTHCSSGREIAFEDIGVGGFFGELAAIDGGPRSASVFAAEDTALGELDGQSFVAAITSHPQVAVEVMKRLAFMVRQASKRVVDISTLPVGARIAVELLRLAAIGTVDGNTAVIRPFPAHSDIASRVSTTRETVARALGTLAHKSLVQRRRNTMVIGDLAQLAAMVDEQRSV
jgi:CRP-like cAMP-binding protein